MPQLTGFIGASYVSTSVTVDCQRCINLFPQPDEMGTGKNSEIASLVSTPGLLLNEAIGTGPHRGSLLASNGRAFVASGLHVYEKFASGAAVSIGTLPGGSGAVCMVDNGVQLAIVDGTNVYIYTFGTGVFEAIAGLPFANPTRIAFMDGYFLANDGGSRKFFFSALYDGTSWDGLDFAEKEGLPDELISLDCDHRELWLLGSQSGEVWFNSGDPDNPFQRIQGAFLELGISAAQTLKKVDNSLLWVGENKEGRNMVWRASQYTPVRVSTFAVENAIQSYGDISAGEAWTYQSNGHTFYCLNFPDADTTWCLDLSTGLWAERKSGTGDTASRHRVQNHMFAFGKHLVGDYQNGNLYELSESTYADNGAAIMRRRRTPQISNSLNWMFFSKFQLDMETGVGLDGTQQGTDPQVMLRYSDDGGKTWSSEKWTSAGRIGEFFHRAFWFMLGRSRARAWEVTITDPVKVTLISAFTEITGGTS